MVGVRYERLHRRLGAEGSKGSGRTRDRNNIIHNRLLTEQIFHRTRFGSCAKKGRVMGAFMTTRAIGWIPSTLVLSFLMAGGTFDRASANPYTDGLSLGVGNETITFASCSVNASGSVGTTACNQLDLEPLTKGSGTFFDPFVYGFGLNAPLSANGDGSLESVTLRYTVVLHDPHFNLAGLEASLDGTQSHVVTLNANLADDGQSAGSLDMDPTTSPQTVYVAPGLRSLDITSVVSVLGTSNCGSGTDPCNNDVSSLSQYFPQDQVGQPVGIPEPASLTSIAAVLGGLALRRGRSRRAAL